ncbi:MAG TPA: hypothetical protein VNY51_14810 [Candidatus Dormibacteraeota bacterium]|jgi:hypothetical protein|nr:hypothetical protein [Candidatus Dormibacteraeota bacterium]
MVKRSQIATFWQSWQPDSPTDQQDFERLKNRVCAVMKNDVWPFWEYRPSLRKEFIVFSGADVASQETSSFWHGALNYQICRAEGMLDLMQAVQALLWAIHKTVPQELRGVVATLNAVFEMSPNVLAHIVLGEDGPTLYRGGAKMLDDALIADNLEWLARHPQALKNFQVALSIYLSKDVSEYRNLLDNLRFAVEQLLRDILQNQKSLENQKDTLLPWMKSKGLHASVTGMYHDLLFKHFAIYQNDAVKHGEKYSPQEIEFMIYLTGTFMRLLIQASKQPASVGQ